MGCFSSFGGDVNSGKPSKTPQWFPGLRQSPRGAFPKERGVHSPAGWWKSREFSWKSWSQGLPQGSHCWNGTEEVWVQGLPASSNKEANTPAAGWAVLPWQGSLEHHFYLFPFLSSLFSPNFPLPIAFQSRALGTCCQMADLGTWSCIFYESFVGVELKFPGKNPTKTKPKKAAVFAFQRRGKKKKKKKKIIYFLFNFS